MNVIIDKIVIIGEDGQLRDVTFNSGLNIITGDSKTGKSALIEIIDYCLFSSRSTVPKGRINDFAKLFVVVLKLTSSYIVIARPGHRTGNTNYAYLKMETTDEFRSKINEDYFKHLSLKGLKVAQEEAEKYLGISTLDTRGSYDDDKVLFGKVTLRSFTSLLFQHQNLITNKHSLFYRFEDFNKRKKTMADFKILMGWANYEYFMYSRELEQKNRELRDILKRKKKYSQGELLDHAIALLSQYYKFIGVELDSNLTLEQIKNLINNLLNMSVITHSNAEYKAEIERMNSARFDMQIELADIISLINKIPINTNVSNEYASSLGQINEIASDRPSIDKILRCPICEHEVEQLGKRLTDLANSKKNLIIELDKIVGYHIDKSEQLQQLISERDKLKREINKLSRNIEKLESLDKEVIKNKSIYESSFELKGFTQSSISKLLEQFYQGDNVDIANLNSQIEELKNKINEFNIDVKIKEAENFLNRKITQICDKLDFENELKPGEFHFSLNDFSFYYEHKRERIYLSEMGSGANWLACHLSIFISFLHLICKEKSSCIPSFLMLDQPSQVYFPRQYNEVDNGDDIEENIRQVKNIFKVLEDEINIIESDCGFKPQVIVMDHADEDEFNSFVIKRWKKEGDKLI